MGISVKVEERGVLFAEILCRKWKKENEKIILKIYIAVKCDIAIVNVR
jgi:hypothetical protein